MSGKSIATRSVSNLDLILKEIDKVLRGYSREGLGIWYITDSDSWG